MLVEVNSKKGLRGERRAASRRRKVPAAFVSKSVSGSSIDVVHLGDVAHGVAHIAIVADVALLNLEACGLTQRAQPAHVVLYATAGQVIEYPDAQVGLFEEALGQV